MKFQLGTLERNLKDLKIRYGLGDIDRETYELTVTHLNEQVANTAKEMNTLVPKVSNLEKLITKALEKLKNISEIWRSSALETKRRIQKTLLPAGVFYDVRNHQYLTKKTNTFLELTSSLSAYYAANEKGTSQSLTEKSLWAPPSGLEPETL